MTKLNSVFRLGQIVPIKILGKAERQDGKRQILASVNPTHINFNTVHSRYSKGMLLWAAVVSKEDHGYHLDSGVANLRMFLPHANIDSGTSLGKSLTNHRKS